MLIQKNELLDQLKSLYEKYEGTMGAINLFGIGDDSDQDQDIWNDWLGLNIGEDIWIWKGTTNPGKDATMHKEGGAAHFATGFHPKIWCLDTHAPSNPSFAHEALCQRINRGCGAIRYWRDINKTFKFDESVNKYETSKECYMNFHRASKLQDVKVIGNYSEGCQVSNHAADLEDILKKIKAVPEFAKNPKGYLFSYLLTSIDEWEELEV